MIGYTVIGTCWPRLSQMYNQQHKDYQHNQLSCTASIFPAEVYACLFLVRLGLHGCAWPLPPMPLALLIGQSVNPLHPTEPDGTRALSLMPKGNSSSMSWLVCPFFGLVIAERCWEVRDPKPRHLWMQQIDYENSNTMAMAVGEHVRNRRQADSPPSAS